MTESDKHQLLAEFAQYESECAFASIVAEHVNLVYSTALRFTGNPHHAEEITQAVFIILARKAGSFSSRTILSGWLYQTTRLTAANFVRGEARRQKREQEAYMQSTLNEAEDAAWIQIAPLLDEAMGDLGETDRAAVVLRFFENKTAAEVATALRTTEAAAHKRINRALEKLRKLFSKRGVTMTTLIIGGAVAANSVQAAPAGLVQTISAVALAKGAAAGGSTLTLVKGMLKIMVWTKAKTVIAVAAGVLLATGTTTVVIEKAVESSNDSIWDVGRVDTSILHKAPPIVRLIPTKFPNQGGWASFNDRILGIGNSAESVVLAAYSSSFTRTVFAAKLPAKKFDFIANLPSGSREALRREVEKKFGVTGQWRTVETNVLFLRVATRNAPGLKPAAKRQDSSNSVGAEVMEYFNAQFVVFADALEREMRIPIIDQTGLTGRFDIRVRVKLFDDVETIPARLQQAVKDQLGLELVPGTAPIEMLVVEKRKK